MKLRIFGGLVTVIAVAVTVFYFVNRPSTSGIAYPSPNGYDAVMAAGESMTLLPLDFDSTQDIEALRQYVNENADQLALLDQAMDQGYLVRSSDMQTMQEMLDRAGIARNSGRLLFTRARLAELEGRSADAADSLLKIAVLGRRSGRGGLLIHQLMAIAIERQGLDGLMQLSTKLAADEKVEVVKILEAEKQIEMPIDSLMEELRFRESEMTKREYGTFLGSFMLWQLSDTEHVEDQYEDVKNKLLEARALRDDLIESLSQPVTNPSTSDVI